MQLFVNEVNESSVFGFRENTIRICSSEEMTNLFFDSSVQIIKNLHNYKTLLGLVGSKTASLINIVGKTKSRQMLGSIFSSIH